MPAASEVWGRPDVPGDRVQPAAAHAPTARSTAARGADHRHAPTTRRRLVRETPDGEQLLRLTGMTPTGAASPGPDAARGLGRPPATLAVDASAATSRRDAARAARTKRDGSGADPRWRGTARVRSSSAQ